jgi:hypothetical protein
MKFQYITSILLMQVTSSVAFAPSSIRTLSPQNFPLNAVPSPEESAQALTKYMAKAHEAKIAALKDLEDKKNAEIKGLKEQLGDAPPAPQPSSAEAASSSESGESLEEMEKKLLSYQKFMSEYIVKAQEDKARAVKEAEAAIAKKYEDKLSVFMLNGAAAPVNGAAAAIAPAEDIKLYEERTANIAAAAAAGKSRWGDKEVQKAGGEAPPSAVLSAAPVVDVASSSSSSTSPPPEVIAADHGLRADGGVDGLSLAERVANGASAVAPSEPVAPKSAANPAFEARNAFIAAAAAAGKQTRWGSMEVSKAIEYKSNALPAAEKVVIEVLPEVEAADHGLRADGGVSGPSLAERVNLGAKLLQ